MYVYRRRETTDVRPYETYILVLYFNDIIVINALYFFSQSLSMNTSDLELYGNGYAVRVYKQYINQLR